MKLCNFGIAGFLSVQAEEDEYVKLLKTEFKYLHHLHGLQDLSTVQWKFLRMRPYNFPSFRLAQFCGLLFKRISWFEFVRISSLEDLMVEMKDVEASSYWSNHFHFAKAKKENHSTTLTKSFIQHLIINAFVPVLFAYGKYICNQELQMKAVDWLQQLPVENNAVISNYKQLNILANNASESQGLIHLYKNYCSAKKCLDCAIGYSVLSR